MKMLIDVKHDDFFDIAIFGNIDIFHNIDNLHNTYWSKGTTKFSAVIFPNINIIDKNIAALIPPFPKIKVRLLSNYVYLFNRCLPEFTIIAEV